MLALSRANSEAQRFKVAMNCAFMPFHGPGSCCRSSQDVSRYIALQQFNFNRSKMIAALRFLHSRALVVSDCQGRLEGQQIAPGNGFGGGCQQ